MSCHHPHVGWRSYRGNVIIGGKQPQNSTFLPLPCGTCLGCQLAKAQSWALRCHLEAQQHRTASFITLTYNNDWLPPTLQPLHLSNFTKKLREHIRRNYAQLRSKTTRTIRFFASGEYGETNSRPHYHAILYGLDPNDGPLVNKTWPFGHTHTDTLNAARIAYVAGYTAKKLGWKHLTGPDHYDPQTGEIYKWEPPFIQMSRNPGIAAHVRKYTDSWRLYAILNGTKMPVPRYLHEAWREHATHEQIMQLQKDKQQHHRNNQNLNLRRLQAAEQIAIAAHAITADKRKL